jgi:DNA-binding NarL/FixJ family response regulator
VIGSGSPAVAFDWNGDLAGGFRQLGLVRILIVDDFELWRRSIGSILAEDADLEVVGECADGLDAVQKSEKLQPDLVLLDINLPKMNGLDAARQIRRVCPRTKILFLSSYQSLEVMREALKIGAAFVVKADAARDLLPIVKAVVRNEPFVRFRFLKDGLPNPGEM